MKHTIKIYQSEEKTYGAELNKIFKIYSSFESLVCDIANLCGESLYFDTSIVKGLKSCDTCLFYGLTLAPPECVKCHGNYENWTDKKTGRRPSMTEPCTNTQQPQNASSKQPASC